MVCQNRVPTQCDFHDLPFQTKNLLVYETIYTCIISKHVFLWLLSKIYIYLYRYKTTQQYFLEEKRDKWFKDNMQKKMGYPHSRGNYIELAVSPIHQTAILGVTTKHNDTTNYIRHEWKHKSVCIGTEPRRTNARVNDFPQNFFLR